MNIVEADNLACPIDGNSLKPTKSQFVCENGHSYDIARQGYVNLLPVQYKRSKEPGDSKAMVLARTNFLNTSVYEAIANKLTEIVKTHIIDDYDYCFLDAGCGEGYYFDALLNDLCADNGAGKLSFIGLDISKDAILQATKRNKQISWVVGTNRHPPVLENSVDIIVCLFGFLSAVGFSKVLKTGGKLILVDPGAEHLSELRKIIYSEVKFDDVENVKKVEIEGFTSLSSHRFQFEMNLTSNEQINNLLLMTPHFYRASKEGMDAAGKLDKLKLTADVMFRVLKKM